jgi:hypothetical protein
MTNNNNGEENEGVVSIDPQALIQAYSDELTQMTNRALMHELAVKTLREQVSKLEHELASARKSGA